MTINYKPKNTNCEKIEQLNIVTKYVNSYYGRFDTSFYVKEQFKYQNYRTTEETVNIILDNNNLFINEHKINLKDLFYISKFNTNKFSCIQQAIGELEIKIRECLCEIVPKDCFVSFVFNNILTRSEIVGITDMLINLMGFKGLLLKPYALAVCFGVRLQHALFINVYKKHTTVFLIDDYWLIDSFTFTKEENRGFNSVDDEDFADDYHKVKYTTDTTYYLCDLCDFRHFSYPKALEHVGYSHIVQDKCECFCKFTEDQRRKKEKNTSGGNFNSTNSSQGFRISDDHIASHLSMYKNENNDLTFEIMKRLSLIYYNIEKLQKINLKINLNDVDKTNRIDSDTLMGHLKEYYGNVSLIYLKENVNSIVLKGVEVFNQLELAKECWLTDEEWRSVRLRVLKEKVLFNL